MTPEEMQKAIIDLQESQKQAKEENDALKVQIAEKTKREKELEEHNQKLFLKITSETKEPEKEVNKELVDFVGEKFYNLLNKKEINELKIIMNGEDE